jgi:hypothetical protein
MSASDRHVSKGNSITGQLLCDGAGIIHKDVDVPEAADGRINESLDVRHLSHVTSYE